MGRGDGREPIVIGLAALALVAAFFVVLSDLRQESLWNDEAWTVWAVHSPYLADTLARVQSDVHPPLYFLLLDGWTLLVGESVLAVRLLSALTALIGLAGTFAVGARLFDRETGLLALIILATSGFFVYYAREARMYSLLLALAALATWAYLRWRSRRTSGRALIYGGLLAALLYTHYAGALIVATHAAHLIITNLWSKRVKSVSPACGRPGNNLKLLLLTAGPYVIAFAVFVPWLLVFLNQMRANPNGPLAFPVPTDWGAVAALALIFSSGYGLLVFTPFVLGSALLRLRQYGSAVLLLVMWLVLTPAVLLALNAWFTPVYQVRYTIAGLTAGALLAAYGLRFAGEWGGSESGRLAVPTPAARAGRERRTRQPNMILPTVHFNGLGTLIRVVLLLVMAYAQLAAYEQLWPDKPPWEMTMRQVIAARQPLEPMITDLAPYSPAAYYGRQLRLRQGITLDLSWRLHSAHEVRDLADRFENAPPVWVALPVNTAKTWHLAAALDAGRGAGYRSSLVNMVFYRFDPGVPSDLQFRFGDRLRFVSGPDAGEQLAVRAGETLCAELTLKTLEALDGLYSAGLHLVDITGRQTVAQWDGGLGTAAAGETAAIAPCLDIPADAAAGYYHLELTIYNWTTVQRLPVFEDGAGAGVLWGDVLMLAAVDVVH